MKVSHMAAGLIGSEIIKLATEIKQRIKEGEQIYNLTIGDFDPEIFPIPEEFSEEIIRSYKAHDTNYPAANGMLELREAVRDFISNREGLEYSADEILISSGARPLIFATYMTLLDPGDKVIYPLPSWNNNHYTHFGRSEALVVKTTPEDNFMPTASLVEPHVKDATIIALCSPLNPTGTIFSKEQLSGICELVIKENKRRGPDKKPLYMLYDQIYWNLVYGENTHLNPVSLYPELKEYVLFIDGMSKAFCATGVRVGWGFGPPAVISKMRSILSHVGAWAPKAEQLAAARYLQMEDKVTTFLENVKTKLSDRLNGFYAGFQSMKSKGYKVEAIAPQAALYLTVKFDLMGYHTTDGKVLEDNVMVHRYLLEEAKVGLVPFTAFGTEDSPWYRLSVGTARMEDIPKIIANLEGALSKLTSTPSRVAQ